MSRGHDVAPVPGLRAQESKTARTWYEQLLGEPTFVPHASEAVWTLAEDRSVYVVEQLGRAGNSVLMIVLDDRHAHIAAIAGRGLELYESARRPPPACAEALYRDPDGNELGFGRAPLDAGW